MLRRLERFPKVPRMGSISVEQAVAKIEDGASLLIPAVFMAVGAPENGSSMKLARQNKRDFTVIANDTAMPGVSIGEAYWREIGAQGHRQPHRRAITQTPAADDGRRS